VNEMLGMPSVWQAGSHEGVLIVRVILSCWVNPSLECNVSLLCGYDVMQASHVHCNANWIPVYLLLTM